MVTTLQQPTPGAADIHSATQGSQLKQRGTRVLIPHNLFSKVMVGWQGHRALLQWLLLLRPEGERTVRRRRRWQLGLVGQLEGGIEHLLCRLQRRRLNGRGAGLAPLEAFSLGDLGLCNGRQQVRTFTVA